MYEGCLFSLLEHVKISEQTIIQITNLKLACDKFICETEVAEFFRPEALRVEKNLKDLEKIDLNNLFAFPEYINIVQQLIYKLHRLSIVIINTSHINTEKLLDILDYQLHDFYCLRNQMTFELYTAIRKGMVYPIDNQTTKKYQLWIDIISKIEMNRQSYHTRAQKIKINFRLCVTIWELISIPTGYKLISKIVDNLGHFKLQIQVVEKRMSSIACYKKPLLPKYDESSIRENLYKKIEKKHRHRDDCIKNILLELGISFLSDGIGDYKKPLKKGTYFYSFFGNLLNIFLFPRCWELAHELIHYLHLLRTASRDNVPLKIKGVNSTLVSYLYDNSSEEYYTITGADIAKISERTIMRELGFPPRASHIPFRSPLGVFRKLTILGNNKIQKDGFGLDAKSFLNAISLELEFSDQKAYALFMGGMPYIKSFDELIKLHEIIDWNRLSLKTKKAMVKILKRRIVSLIEKHRRECPPEGRNPNFDRIMRFNTGLGFYPSTTIKWLRKR